LNQVRRQLLNWANYDGSPNWYDGASGLIFEMTNRYGEDSVVRFMCELAKEPVPGGGGLKRAFKRATNMDLEEFLRTYETPWIGIEVGQIGCEVKVTNIYPATPASRRGANVGDIIVSLAGRPITSTGEFNQTLACQRSWQVVPIVIKRGDEILPMKVKLIPRPVDIKEFLRLSGVSNQ
jgi:predicted metalloprotease with PDZ domain